MDEIIRFLQNIPTLSEVPLEQLEWLVRESEILYLEPGTTVRPGEPNILAEYMTILIEGSFEAYVVQNGQRRTQMIVGPGAMTGLLPFSRMKSSVVFIDAIPEDRSSAGRVKVLALHRSKFHALIAVNYELTEALVHSLIDRVRLFTSTHFQNEKLMALGKLSAGLSHELNNPAAAVVRSAEDLKKIVGGFGTSLRAIARLQLHQEEVDKLSQIIERVTKTESIRLPLLERKRREDEISDWLADHDVADGCEETFASAGMTTADLDHLKSSISEAAFKPFLNWLGARLQTEKAVEEIATSSRRISELVQSVKSYTRMDQAQAMQPVDINDGIRNTITMLEYKARRERVTIAADLQNDPPTVLGFPGELNQVWTNIIDNAIDAMKTGGELTIRTSSVADVVTFSAIDSGPGIPPENLERIFDPFFTTKDVGEGTGVGLDLVQKVVRQHRGTIKVTSKPGRTEFNVSFPISHSA